MQEIVFLSPSNALSVAKAEAPKRRKRTVGLTKVFKTSLVPILQFRRGLKEPRALGVRFSVRLASVRQ